jgi:hypothetical protein
MTLGHTSLKRNFNLTIFKSNFFKNLITKTPLHEKNLIPNDEPSISLFLPKSFIQSTQPSLPLNFSWYHFSQFTSSLPPAFLSIAIISSIGFVFKTAVNKEKSDLMNEFSYNSSKQKDVPVPL